MEFNNNPMANSTFGAFTVEGGAQSPRFGWQNPMFALPSSPGRATSPDRVPGSVRSNRPRWTPAKHARIVSQIKASRPDLYPSFPRSEPDAQSGGQAGAQPSAKGAVHEAAKVAKSYFDSLMESAIEQIYGPAVPEAGPGAAHSTTGAGKAPSVDLAAAKSDFVDALRGAGMSQQQAEDIVYAWTAAHIPLNPHTLPHSYREKYVFKAAEQKRSGASGAFIVEQTDITGIPQLVKCYPPTSTEVLQLFDELVGIDGEAPKREVRVLLASHIAHEMLKWSITPEVKLAFLGGRVCVISPYSEGRSFTDIFNNSIQLQQAFYAAWEGYVYHPDRWTTYFDQNFQHDYIKISLFAMLLGDIDRHLGQYLVSGMPMNSVMGIDWDGSFGARMTNDEIYMTPTKGKYISYWPASVPKKIAEEFCALTEESLRETAIEFGLSDAEAAALMSRFGVIKKKLATIKKT